MFILIRRLF